MLELHHSATDPSSLRETTPTKEKKIYFHENCVFNQLTSTPQQQQSIAQNVSGGSGYDSDSSFMIKKKTNKTGNF